MHTPHAGRGIPEIHTVANVHMALLTRSLRNSLPSLCELRGYSRPGLPRPFRVYDGEPIVLVGNDMFPRSRALSHDSGQGLPWNRLLCEDSTISFNTEAQARAGRDAPYHAGSTGSSAADSH
jgi:hypothetical protein